MNIFFALISCSFIVVHHAYSLQSTSTPPLLDVPTYSLATQDPNGKTGMNILTYASPVSAKPDRMWTIALFKGTVAHENFSTTGTGVLQMLMPCHAKLVRLLGGSSGRDVDKRNECDLLGFQWIPSNDVKDPELLPDCACYLKLQLVGDLIDCGSHEVAVCKVESILVHGERDEPDRNYLNTAQLREMGLITEQGRVAD